MADGTVQSLRDRIDETIGKAHPTIHDQVHSHFVDAEVTRRSQIVVGGINVLREIENDLKKVDRPDSNLFNADGSPAQTTYTRGRLDEIKKHRERKDRLEALLTKVIETNALDDYKKLEDTIKKGGGKGGSTSVDE